MHRVCSGNDPIFNLSKSEGKLCIVNGNGKRRKNLHAGSISADKRARGNPEKRGGKMAKRLPWSKLESDYMKYFRSCGCVEVTLNAQVVIGSFMIKKILGLCDCGVVDAMSVSAIFSRFQKFSV